MTPAADRTRSTPLLAWASPTPRRSPRSMPRLRARIIKAARSARHGLSADALRLRSAIAASNSVRRIEGRARRASPSRFAPIRQRQLTKAVRRISARLRNHQHGLAYRNRHRVWSSPCAGPLAQLVEHSTFNRVVEGSIPSRPTTNTLKQVTILKPCHRSSARLPALAAPHPALSGNGADCRNRTHPGHRDLTPSRRPVEPGPMTEPPLFP